MSDDLERAVLCQFDPSGHDAALKAEAAAYCEQVKASPRWWEVLVERCNRTPYVEVKFWCLQSLLEILPKKYAALESTAKVTLREAFVRWLLDPAMSQQPELLRNKLAQTVTAVVRLEYPKTWPSFFHDLIGALDQGPSVADMFCRVLLAIDSDIISLDIHRSVQEQKVSVQLKDTMRETCIDAIVDAWYKLVLHYCTTLSDLTVLVLQTLQKYISWMSTGLVVNNQFMPLLFDLLKLDDEALQEASIDCLNEILLKGMEPSTKIHVVQKMGIVPCCMAWKDGLPGTENAELRIKCAKLLATLCSEILECWKRVENGCISMRACKIDIKTSVKNEANQICANCEKMIDSLFPAVLAVIQTREDETCMTVVPFLSAYVLRLKHFQEREKVLPEKEMEVVKSVLRGVLVAARYPEASEIPPGPYESEVQRIGAVEETETVAAKRRDLFTILKNIVRIQHQMVTETLLEQLQITLHDAAVPFQDVEILITAVFEMGEVQSSALLDLGCGSLATLVLPLIRAEIPNRHHQLVALSILELYLRFHKVPLYYQQEFPKVLSTFIGPHGIRHNAEVVSDRACYLFVRFVKSCRGVMKPFVMSVLQSLQDFFAATLQTPRQKPIESVTSDSRLHVFEAAGLLIGLEDLDPDPQKDALISMLHPAMHHFEGAEEWSVLQALEVISRLSKGFKQEFVTTVRPAIGEVFVQCLERALHLPSKIKSPVVYSRVTSFLHRMIELLGNVTLPFLQPAFEVLLREGKETCRMIELVTLSHQLATAFGERLTAFLRAALPVLLRQIWLCLEAEWDWTGRTRHPGSKAQDRIILDDVREKEQLQRLYYGLCYAIFANCDASLLLELPSDTLQFLLNTVLQGARLHVEVPIRRICFQILNQLMQKWSERMKADGALQEWVLVEIAQGTCIRTATDGGLDVNDAATNSLFQDMASCTRSVWLCCSEVGLRKMQEAIQAAALPTEFGTELEKQLRGGGKLRDYFKAVVNYARK